MIFHTGQKLQKKCQPAAKAARTKTATRRWRRFTTKFLAVIISTLFEESLV
jgi:hypothetical protein